MYQFHHLPSQITKQPHGQPQCQGQQAFGVHHCGWPARILRRNGAQRVTNQSVYRSIRQNSKPGLPAVRRAPRRRRFRSGRCWGWRGARSRRQDCATAPARAVAGKGRSRHPQSTCQAAGQASWRIIQFGGTSSKIQIPFVFVAEHAVIVLMAFIGQRQRRTAHSMLKQRAMTPSLAFSAYRSPPPLGHALAVRFWVSRPTMRLRPCARRAGRHFAVLLHIHAFLYKARGRQACPAPEHLHQTPQSECSFGRQPAWPPAAGNSSVPSGSTRRHDRHHPAVPTRRCRQRGAQAFFQRRDAPPHHHHRVGARQGRQKAHPVQNRPVPAQKINMCPPWCTARSDQAEHAAPPIVGIQHIAARSWGRTI